MGKIFHIYASQGRHNYVELDLPASDHEMLDLMERLRLGPGQLPYLELLKCDEEFDYLDECIHGSPDIYQLNALAGKLSEFTSIQEKAAFEGLVGKELERGTTSIELPKLIDFAYSADCCNVIEDAVTHVQLGQYLVKTASLRKRRVYRIPCWRCWTTGRSAWSARSRRAAFIQASVSWNSIRHCAMSARRWTSSPGGRPIPSCSR